MMLSLSTLLASSLMLVNAASAFQTVDIRGRYFFYENGTRFYLRGIAYQRDPKEMNLSEDVIYDPLADHKACERDVSEFKKLNLNAVRVYAINHTAEHDHCMNLLKDNNIYVIADLSQPNLSIESGNPSWTTVIMDRYTKVIDAMAKYDNVLAFFGGNEVINQTSVSGAAPFVKASIRDIREYIKEKNYRHIPVGYSTDDHEDTRKQISEFFVCDNDASHAEFLGINMYEWCGDSSIEQSGYGERTREFQNYPVPLFFSEYGCNKVEPRKFTEVQALYGKQMTDVWSGGLVFMYVNQSNNYGIVDIDKDGNLKELPDFKYLSSELNAVKPTKLMLSDYTKTKSATANVPCPTKDDKWLASNKLPGVASDLLCECMYNSLDCVVKDDVDQDDFKEVFNFICGEINCKSINKNGTTGVYGAYSVCSPRQQLSFVMNQYYEKQGSRKACDYNGKAVLRGALDKPSKCDAYLKSAGADGATPVFNVPVGTISATGSAATETGKPSGKDKSKSKNKKNGTVPSSHFNSGLIVFSIFSAAFVTAIAV